MKMKDFERAKEIVAEIEEIQKQIILIPRSVINRNEYENSGHKYMYIRRLFRKFYNGKENVLTAYKEPGVDYVLELSEEDLQALVEIRRIKLLELKKELENLGTEENKDGN